MTSQVHVAAVADAKGDAVKYILSSVLLLLLFIVIIVGGRVGTVRTTGEEVATLFFSKHTHTYSHTHTHTHTHHKSQQVSMETPNTH